MKRVALKVAALATLALMVMPAVHAADKPTESQSLTHSMTVWQARRSVLASIASARTGRFGIMADRSSFRWTIDGFEFDATLQNSSREHFKVDLKSLETVFARKRRFRLGYMYVLTDDAGRDLPSPLDRLNYDAAVAESLAVALNHLRVFAGEKGAKLREFPQRAAAWRALPSKPPVPEEVRVQRLLAEDAVKQNKPGEALNCYETGLEIYPTWPQGRFNAALIAAELGLYEDAIEHMQAYLELAPDASDGQSTRDQIVIWQHKAKGSR
jgi:tetratricopeptide (TPR) repeat protein